MAIKGAPRPLTDEEQVRASNQIANNLGYLVAGGCNLLLRNFIIGAVGLLALGAFVLYLVSR